MNTINNNLINHLQYNKKVVHDYNIIKEITDYYYNHIHLSIFLFLSILFIISAFVFKLNIYSLDNLVILFLATLITQYLFAKISIYLMINKQNNTSLFKSIKQADKAILNINESNSFNQMTNMVIELANKHNLNEYSEQIKNNLLLVEKTTPVNNIATLIKSINDTIDTIQVIEAKS